MAYNQELFETYITNYVEAQTAFDAAIEARGVLLNDKMWNEETLDASLARVQTCREKADKAYRDAIKFLVAYGNAHE